MKVIWVLRASIKDINFKSYYSEYDDKCLQSKYWIEDITSFINDNMGIVKIKKCSFINEYEITFEIQKYNFNPKDFIKFSSGRFRTHSLSCIMGSWKIC